MRGSIKMKFSITFRTDDDIKSLCEKLASECQYSCPVGMLPCPFKISKNCYDVTADDWAKIIKVSKKSKNKDGYERI